MLLVKTEIKPSSIHGIGLFAGEDIAAGTLVWEFREPFDRHMPESEFYALPQIAQEHVRQRSMHSKDGWYLFTGDNDRFINHSEFANLITNEEISQSHAARNIARGEELTEDYRLYNEPEGLSL